MTGEAKFAAVILIALFVSWGSAISVMFYMGAKKQQAKADQTAIEAGLEQQIVNGKVVWLDSDKESVMRSAIRNAEIEAAIAEHEVNYHLGLEERIKKVETRHLGRIEQLEDAVAPLLKEK